MARRRKASSEFDARSEGFGDPSLAPLYYFAGLAVVCLQAKSVMSPVELELLGGGRYVIRGGRVRLVGEPREAWLYTTLAGPIAARMYSGVLSLDPDDEGITRIARFLAETPQGEPTRASGRAWTALTLVEDASYVLWRHWWAVEAAARELLTERTLTVEAVQLLAANATTGSQRPLVPKADDVLRQLEGVLRQKHGLLLGDWRSCPREAPMPA